MQKPLAGTSLCFCGIQNTPIVQYFGEFVLEDSLINSTQNFVKTARKETECDGKAQDLKRVGTEVTSVGTSIPKKQLNDIHQISNLNRTGVCHSKLCGFARLVDWFE